MNVAVTVEPTSARVWVHGIIDDICLFDSKILLKLLQSAFAEPTTLSDFQMKYILSQKAVDIGVLTSTLREFLRDKFDDKFDNPSEEAIAVSVNVIQKLKDDPIDDDMEIKINYMLQCLIYIEEGHLSYTQQPADLQQKMALEFAKFYVRERKAYRVETNENVVKHVDKCKKIIDAESKLHDRESEFHQMKRIIEDILDTILDAYFFENRQQHARTLMNFIDMDSNTALIRDETYRVICMNLKKIHDEFNN